MFATKFARNRNLVRCFSNFTANPNSTFPAFTPKDNSTGSVNWDLHNKEKWTSEEVNQGMGQSIWSWGATDMLRARTVNVDYSEGIYMYDHSGKKYIDWCSGAVCINLGHTVPDSIR
jgi:4-aminobutyrate aminotransferase-like enzyme